MLGRAGPSASSFSSATGGAGPTPEQLGQEGTVGHMGGAVRQWDTCRRQGHHRGGVQYMGTVHGTGPSMGQPESSGTDGQPQHVPSLPRDNVSVDRSGHGRGKGIYRLLKGIIPQRRQYGQRY